MSEELKTTLKERLRSPLFGNFIVSWLIVNWKIPYLTVFVSEKVLKGKTKIEEIKNIIDGYKSSVDWYDSYWMMLFGWPFISMVFMILVYPFIFNWLEILRLYFQTWLKEIHEKRDSDLLPIKVKYENLSREKNQLAKDMLEDFKYSLFQFKDNRVERLFAGRWTIEIHEKNKSVLVYENCYFKNAVFSDSAGVIFYVNNIEAQNEPSQYHNSNYKLKITINKETYEYTLNIQTRILLELNRINDYETRIRFIWKGI